MIREYVEFLKSKMALSEAAGFEPAQDIHPLFKPHQIDVVRWALRGGRRAIFAAFGLGKTFMQLEIMRHIAMHEHGRQLIIMPLGVRLEFIRDAEKLDMEVRFVRRHEEVNGDGIYITNYESVRDGRLDVNLFNAVSLDEASVLRGYGTKTFQTFLSLFSGVKYRFVATATPSPNRYKELIHYAGFLGIMDTGQALTRFFKRDSTKANNLTLYPHMEHEFWLWMASWAIFLQKPSDLGYSDDGYILPELKVIYHEVKAHREAIIEDDGQVRMFADAAMSLKDASREKRESIAERVDEVKRIIDRGNTDDHWIIWHDQEAERHAIKKVVIPWKSGLNSFVVRENNQTYRLGWTEQCKDGTKMGVGSPEYVLLFRKLPTDTSRAYADHPVTKSKEDYSRARWQVDAHAFWRSSGDRMMTAEEMAELKPDVLCKLFAKESLKHIYDYEHHVKIGERLDAKGKLSSTFMTLAPASHHPNVWTDVNRMRTLNGEQTRRGLNNHICPLQFDIVDRLIERYSNPGETVFDPFGGLMTVPYRAILKSRHGMGVELNADYWRDGVKYLEMAERKIEAPTLFSSIGIEQEALA